CRGTSNNYSRTADEVDNQDQWDVRIDHRINNADQLFARLTHFLEDAIPVTAFPDGSGALAANSISVGPQNSSNWSFASNYQHLFSNNLMNEVRFGDTRRAIERSAAQLSSAAAARPPPPPPPPPPPSPPPPPPP